MLRPAPVVTHSRSLKLSFLVQTLILVLLVVASDGRPLSGRSVAGALDSASEPSVGEAAAGTRARPEQVSRFAWPVSGPVSSLMDDDHPLGIDIGLTARPGSVIKAVEHGTVAFAGGKDCCGYGLHVILEHVDGLKTIYAHLSRIDVSEGDQVFRSQQLGISGSTGLARGEHLHFEVRRDRERLNPMAFLPRPCSFIHPNPEYKGFAMDGGDCASVPHEGLVQLPWPLDKVLGALIARMTASTID